MSDMPRVKVSTLKQSPYGFIGPTERVDPTRDGVQKAIDEGRFSAMNMDKDYPTVRDEILKKTQDTKERNRLMREFHEERIAELVRTKDAWLDKPSEFPITINKFNEVRAGNHRFRAIRYLGLDEVEVAMNDETVSHPEYGLPEIW